MFASENTSISTITSALPSSLTSNSFADSFANTFDLSNFLSVGRSSQQVDTPLMQSPHAAKNPNPNHIFNDGVTLPDFNGDGKTDKFWRNSQTGEIAIWLMDSTKPTGVSLPQLDSSWDFTFGDFNGDGRESLVTKMPFISQTAVSLVSELRHKRSVLPSPLKSPRL